MQFKAFISAALLAATSYAQLQFTSFPPAGLQVGQAVNLTWTGATPGQPITILLRNGNSANLQTQQTITSSATGNSYIWTPSSTLPDGADYALQIVQGDMNNYTPQFSIQGGTAASVSASQSNLLSSLSASASSVLSPASRVIANQTMTSSSASITSSASTSRASGTSTTSSTRTSSTGGATNTGAANSNNVQSPLALILGAAAAMVYLA